MRNGANQFIRPTRMYRHRKGCTTWSHLDIYPSVETAHLAAALWIIHARTANGYQIFLLSAVLYSCTLGEHVCVRAKCQRRLVLRKVSWIITFFTQGSIYSHIRGSKKLLCQLVSISMSRNYKERWGGKQAIAKAGQLCRRTFGQDSSTRIRM